MLIGLRRAIVLLILAFFALQLGMTALFGPEELTAAMAGLTACYLLAFFGVAAEWFWARWFAIGLGNFGSLMLLVLFKTGFEPIFAFIGGAHLLIMVLMSGEGMAAHYEYSPKAQERYNFEEESLATLRRAVKSAGSTLPILILYGLAPGEESMLQLGALGLGLLGVYGLLSQRTWSLFALAGAGSLALVDALELFGPAPDVSFLLSTNHGTPLATLLGQSSSQLVSSPGFALLAAGILIVPMLYAPALRRALFATVQGSCPRTAP